MCYRSLGILASKGRCSVRALALHAETSLTLLASNNGMIVSTPRSPELHTIWKELSEALIERFYTFYLHSFKPEAPSF